MSDNLLINVWNSNMEYIETDSNDVKIDELETELGEKESTIESLNDEIDEKDSQIEMLEEQEYVNN